MEQGNIKTIKAIEEIIELFEIEFLDDYMLETGVGVMRKPYLKEGMVRILVTETGLPPAFVTAAVDLIYMIEEFE